MKSHAALYLGGVVLHGGMEPPAVLDITADLIGWMQNDLAGPHHETLVWAGAVATNQPVLEFDDHCHRAILAPAEQHGVAPGRRRWQLILEREVARSSEVDMQRRKRGRREDFGELREGSLPSLGFLGPAPTGERLKVGDKTLQVAPDAFPELGYRHQHLRRLSRYLRAPTLCRRFVRLTYELLSGEPPGRRLLAVNRDVGRGLASVD